MTSNNNQNEQAVELRLRAEAIAKVKASQSSPAETLQWTAEKFAALSPEEIGLVFHELQVHQIELEMQNEELRRTQIELHAARARYFDLYDLAPAGYITVSEHGLIIEANLTSAKLLGIDRNAMIKQPLSTFIFKEDQNTYYLHRKQLFENGKSQTYELRMTKNDGTVFWANIAMTAAWDTDGETVGRMVMIDLSDRRQTMELEERNTALRAASIYSRNLLETSLDPLVTISVEGKITDVNAATEKITGISRERLIGSDFSDYFTEPEIARAAYMKAFAQGQIIDYPLAILHTSGTVYHVLYNASVFRNEQGEVLGVFAAARDITDRKHAEEALRESEEKYRTLHENMPVGLVRTSPVGDVIFANPAMVKIFGYESIEEFQKINVTDLYLNIEDRKLLLNMLETNGSVLNFETQMRRKDGVIIWASTSINAVFSNEGKFLYLDGFCKDITSQKKDAEKIVHLNELLLAIRNVVELISKEKNAKKLIQGICDSLIRSKGFRNIWIMLTDNKNNIITASGSGFGSKFIDNLINFNNVSSLNCLKQTKNTAGFIIIKDTFCCDGCKFCTGDKDIGRIVIQLKYNNKIYGLMNIGVHKEFINEELEQLLLQEVAEDMAFGLNNIKLENEKKELQTQVYRSAKLSAVGQLAAGIAHEFNNLLSIILGHAQLSLDENSIDEIKNSLREIEKSSRRGRDIVIKLASFAKPKEPEFKTQNIEKIIDDIIHLQERQLQLESVKIETKYDIKSMVFLDRGQMEQVFLNLLINSVHAMKPKGGGRIIITVKETGDFIEVRFCDNGIGMDRQTKVKIFNPFFTTKGAWAKDGYGISGTGLGLSIVHSIIKHHNGTIAVKSQKNKGTTFIIKLPIDTKGSVASETPGYNINEYEKEKIKEMRILLVDDENEITGIFKQFFKKAGFQNYKLENNSEKTVSIYKEFKPDVVFLDIIMPGKGGEKILKEIKSIDKKTPVILMSGTVDRSKDIFLKNGAFDFIQKPFGIAEFYNILNKIKSNQINNTGSRE